jgi:hypothetical protein
MRISPFTPIFFAPSGCTNGIGSRYVQTFAPTDRILIEIIASVGDTAPAATINDAVADSAIDSITWNSWTINTSDLLFFTEINGLSDGYYTITIAGVTSELFRISSDESVLSYTTLVQYAMKDNKQRTDVVSIIDNMKYFFDFRVPGGFKDGGWSWGVSNEQFSTQDQDIIELYSRDYTNKTFTLGGSIGVPVWFADLFNRLLTCSYVYLDGTRYSRNEQEVPSVNEIIEGLNSFVFTQVLRKAQIINVSIEETNQLAIRRVDSDTYREVEDGDSTEPLILTQ